MVKTRKLDSDGQRRRRQKNLAAMPEVKAKNLAAMPEVKAKNLAAVPAVKAKNLAAMPEVKAKNSGGDARGDEGRKSGGGASGEDKKIRRLDVQASDKASSCSAEAGQA